MKRAPTQSLSESASGQIFPELTVAHIVSKVSVGDLRISDNPRDFRAVDALLKGDVPREMLDRITGSSNSPELVAGLRRRGLEIKCYRVPRLDRDGKLCRPGVYRLSPISRPDARKWVASAARVGAKAP